jgi:hypothetical protein
MNEMTMTMTKPKEVCTTCDKPAVIENDGLPYCAASAPYPKHK